MIRKALIPFLIAGIFSLVFAFPGNSQEPPGKRPKVGLVLSGGGAKGIAHIGVLRVLEEAGIKVDYIGGTSMGSIIGALYAIGYHPDSMAAIIKEQNWMQLLSDGYPRTLLSIEEKEVSEKYIASFPVSGKGIEIPQGLVEGQNITNLFTRLCSRYSGVRDFSELPIPFFCVATDIETGQKVVLDKGYLPDAMRASMAIPSFFTPVEINGRLLVDGGLIDNYPVNELRERGAEIIIGVSVTNSINKREHLKSFLDIIKQSVFFYGDRNYQENIAATDLFIHPDLSRYSIAAFEECDSLIAVGEREARLYLSELKALADTLNGIRGADPNQLNTTPIDSILIKEIIVDGLKNVSGKLFSGKLQLRVMEKIPLKELDKAVERVYGSRFFRKVVYELVPLEDSSFRVIFHVVEANTGSIGVGIHFDTENESAILLNATLRNILFNGSKLTGDLELGINPRISANYFVNRGLLPGFGLLFNAFTTDVYIYENDKRVSNFRYGSVKFGAYSQAIYENNITFGIGPELEWTSIKDKVTFIELGTSTNTNFAIKSFFKFNTFDKFVYPSSGIKILARAEFVTPFHTKLVDSIIAEKYTQTNLFSFEYQQAIEIFKRVVLKPKLSCGLSFSDHIPPQYNFLLGGIGPTYLDNAVVFYGLDFMQKPGSTYLLGGLAFQSEIFKRHYITLNLNLASTSEKVRNLFSTGDNSYRGFGLTYGYNSVIGPLEITITGSNVNKQLASFLNIGFWLY